MPKTSQPVLDRLAEQIRTMRYSPRTASSYVHWTRQYLKFHHPRQPSEMGMPEVQHFLTYLAKEKNASIATQNQALSALVFLYRHVLDTPLDSRGVTAARTSSPRRMPVVLTREEAIAVIDALQDTDRLAAGLMYGSGLRVMEALRLRVGDIDFAERRIAVRDGNGAFDRTTLLPEALARSMDAHLHLVKGMHEKDLAEGYGAVYLPPALEQEHPQGHKDWAWQYVFPAGSRSLDPQSGAVRRHHVHETSVQKAIRSAAHRAGVTKHVTPHVLRHSFAAHLLQAGYDIRLVQALLGHKDIKTTMIYTQMVERNPQVVRSPLDE